MKIFITGATGVVGARAVPMLTAAGYEVRAVVRSAEKGALVRAAGAYPIEVDLFDPAALRSAIADHAMVINLATHMPPLDLRAMLPGAWAENDRIRRIASANLARAALANRVERFIQESFAPVYPDCGDNWIAEDTPIAPLRYNRTVADAERAATMFSEEGGIGIVLRFAAFYGPDADQFTSLIGAVRKGWVPLPGDPAGFISSVSHDDAASAVVAAQQAPPGFYNVVDDEPLRRRAFYDALAEYLGVARPKIPPAWMAPLLGSTGRLLARSQRMSNGKFRAAAGWAPKFPSVREGFRAALAEIK
jgi:nucleoside-diphosphate-sugar epimerase